MISFQAVIWTDCFQALCMFGSYLGITIYGSQALGGAARVWDLSYQAGRVELFNLDPDPRQRHTLWCDDSDDNDNYDGNDTIDPRGLMVGTTVLWVSVYGTNQAMVQRYSTVQRRSQVIIVTMIVTVIMMMIMIMIIRLSPPSD